MGSAQALFAVSGGGGGRGFNQIQTIGQTQPLGDYSPETQAKLAQAERRRQITNLLVQKGLQGGPPATSAGRFIVPRGAMQNLGDLATLMAGLYGNYKADESAQAAIAEENKAYQEAIAGYKSRLAGVTDQAGVAARPAIPAQPATTMTGQSEDENVYTPPTAAQPAIEAVPASTAQKQQAILDALLQSRIPAVQRYGFQQQVALDADVAREEAREEQRARETFQAKEHQLTRDLTAAQAKSAQDASAAAHAAQQAWQSGESQAARAWQEKEQTERLTAQHEERERDRVQRTADLQEKLGAGVLTAAQQRETQLDIARMGRESAKERNALLRGKSTPKEMAAYTAGLKEVAKDEQSVIKARDLMTSLDRWVALNANVDTGPISGRRPVSWSPDYQELGQLENKLAMSNFAPGQGAMSNFEREKIGGAGPNRTNNRETNANIVAVLRGATKTMMDRADFHEWYLEQHGKLLGADKMWDAYVEQHPRYRSDKTGALTENVGRMPWLEYFASAPGGENPLTSGDIQIRRIK